MKKLLLILLILQVSCAENTSQKTENNTTSMNWIIGKWIRINDSSTETKTYEDWSKISENEYKGHGFVVKNDTTVWEEHLRLLNENNQWIFEVTGVNESPTIFQITEKTENSFISKNPENKFPKQISYALENDKLIAKISGGAPEIVFEFSSVK